MEFIDVSINIFCSFVNNLIYKFLYAVNTLYMCFVINQLFEIFELQYSMVLKPWFSK